MRTIEEMIKAGVPMVEVMGEVEKLYKELEKEDEIAEARDNMADAILNYFIALNLMTSEESAKIFADCQQLLKKYENSIMSLNTMLSDLTKEKSESEKSPKEMLDEFFASL